MTEFLSNIFVGIFGDNVVLATILIAMVPIIELRGAIPFATNPGFWGETNALTNWAAMGWSLLGSSLIVPIIAIAFVPLMNWLKKTRLFGKLAVALENRIKSKSEKIEGAEEKTKHFTKGWWKKVLAVFLFVAVPLPLTGVWTGTLVAVFIGLDYLTSCVTVITGNVIAALLISLILQFFPALNDWLFYIFIIIVLVIILYEVIRHFITKKKKEAEEGIEKPKLTFKEKCVKLKDNSTFRGFVSICTILLVGFLIIIPLLANGVVNGHDSEYHFAFIRSLNEAWQEGTFTNRIFGLIGQDYGYGSGLFYSRIPAGITVILMNLLGMNVIGALTLEFFLLFSLSGLVTYFFAKKIFNNKALSLITAIVYMAFPYFLTNLYVRFAFSEMFIMLAFPMIIWGIYELIENKNYKLFMFFFTAGYILALLTHIALTIFITIFVGVYILCNIKKMLKDKTWIPFIISCIIVVISILFFYIPMVLNLGITQQSGMGRDGMWLWGTSASIFWEPYLVPSTYPTILVFIVFNIMFFMKKEKKTRNEKILYIFTTSSLVLLSPIFPWFIMGISPFNMIQFAWRMFSIVSLPIAFMLAYITKNIKLKSILYSTLAVTVATLSICLGISPTLHPYQQLNDASLNFESYFSSDCGLGGGKNGDYFPTGTTREYLFGRGNNLIEDTDLEILELANYQTINKMMFFLHPIEKAGFVTFKIPYNICENIVVAKYKTSSGDRSDIKLTKLNDNGNLKIEIPETDYCQIVISYEDNSVFDKYLQENSFEFLVKSGNATASNFVKQNVNTYKVDFDVTEETVVELPTFFYKGYTLTYKTTSGEVKTLEAVHGENGFIEVKLTESGTLNVEFKPNYIKYSDIISILGIVIFLIACGVVLCVPRRYFTAVADWIDRFLEKYRTVAEIIRFLVVGAISTLFDMFFMGVVMYLMQPSIYASFINVFINSPNPSTLATIIGTTVGSIVGMIVSYFLSVIFVFNEKGESKSIKGFVIFALLTAIGLGINMLGTYIGYDLLHIHQWITKIVMIIVVLIYNYISKRLMLFKDKPKTAEDKILDILLEDVKKNKKHK